MAQKPAYHHGQLLLEEDFVAEQQFHLAARYRHVLNLHGFGAARGLEVARAGDTTISVSTGFAVDRKGREIVLEKPETLEVGDLPPHELAWVTIGYRTERLDKDRDNRIDCYADLRVAAGVEQFDVRLARVQLDEHGRLTQNSISTQDRDQLRTIAPGSVTAETLAPPLRKGWVTMPFHPSSMPQDDKDARPPFRIGATQVVAEKTIDGKDNARGAAGTMAIVLPPGIRRIHRFRVAGEENKASMTVELIKGGFDLKAMRHWRQVVVNLTIPKGPSGSAGAYCETVKIPEAHRSLDDRLRTLAVDIRSEGFAAVSLVAIQVSY